MAMFGEGHLESIARPCLEEALACQDLLEPAPRRPTPWERLLARLAAICATVRPGRGRRAVHSAHFH